MIPGFLVVWLEFLVGWLDCCFGLGVWGFFLLGFFRLFLCFFKEAWRALLWLSSYSYYLSLIHKPKLFKKFSIPLTVHRHERHLSHYLSSCHPQIWVRTGSPDWRQCQWGLRARQKELSLCWGSNRTLREWVGRKAQSPVKCGELINTAGIAGNRQVAHVPRARYSTLCAANKGKLNNYCK